MLLKKAFSFIISFAILCMSFSTIISSAFNENDWYAESNTLWGYYGIDTDIELPTQMYGNNLEKVGDYFGSGYTWNSVIIPEGYTDICECSFNGNDQLQSMVLPNSLKTIGFMAFAGCTNSNLVIDIKSTSLTSIGENAFLNVVGTIKVYSQEMYDLISANATTANVVISSAFNENDWYAESNTLWGYYGIDTDIELPTQMYGNNLEKVGDYFGSGYTWNSVIIPEGYTDICECSFNGNDQLQSMVLPNSLKTIGFMAFAGCTNSNLVIDIKSTSLTSIGENAFLNVVGTIKVHSQEMYDLISANATTANVVLVSSTDPTDPPTPSLDYTNLNKALEDGEAVDTSKYTEATAKALEEAILSGKAVKDNTSATQTDIDNAAKAIEEALNALVAKADYSALYKAMEDAKKILDESADKYTEDSLGSLQDDLDTANRYLDKYGDTLNQETVDYLVGSLQRGIDNLVKIDLPAMIAELQTVIGTASALDASDYTDESYKVLADIIAAASELNETSNYKDILAAQSNIESAVKKLILKPLEEFVKIYKNGAVAILAKGTADSSMNGATSVRVTFNCAADVSYNPNASIELKAVVSGAESYEKFMGTDANYTNGANGCTETLALTNAIAEGQSYEISAFTYAWSNAADYVYAVSKVEFLDAEGKVLSKVTATTAAMNDLEKALAEAKDCDPNEYTETSFAVLTTAIEVAEAIAKADKATVADITAATQAIRDAIAKLEEKIKTGTVSGTINVSDKSAGTEITITAVSADETKEEISVTATSMGTYTIENLETGDYTLIISGGKYTARNYKVTVTESGITQDAELNPYGDVNGDGKVTTADYGLANAHVRGVRILEGYAYDCANVSDEDADVTTADAGKINSHAKGVTALW